MATFRIGKIEKKILSILKQPVEKPQGVINGITYGRVFNGRVYDLNYFVFNIDRKPTTSETRTIYRAVTNLKKKGLVDTAKKKMGNVKNVYQIRLHL